MAHADLIRTDEGMPVLPDISKMSDTQKINALFAYIRQEQDYIVRLKEQIGASWFSAVMPSPLWTRWTPFWWTKPEPL